MSWQFYDLTTGQFVGRSYAGFDTSGLAANTPPGCGAWAGQVDWQTQRVDLATGELVAHQVAGPSLQAVKAARWAAIKTAREAACCAPLVTPYGTFDHQPPARLAILMLANGAAVTSSAVVATLADNTTVSLGPTQSAEVLQMSHEWVQAQRAIATTLRAQIDAAADAAAVQAIQWPSSTG